jgi:hypothetical protein
MFNNRKVAGRDQIILSLSHGERLHICISLLLSCDNPVPSYGGVPVESRK